MATQLVDKNSVKAIIAEMSVEEKATLITGRSSFMTHALPKYGIPACRVLDGGTGVNLFQYYGDIMGRALAEGDSNIKNSLSGVGNSTMFMQILNKGQAGEELTEEERKTLEIINKEMDDIVPSKQLPGCFPPGMMLGATWNPKLAYDCGNAVGKEMDVYKVDMVLGSPNVNIHRDPLNGRLFEGYSEDPCLASKMAPEFVKGLQDEGLIADAKHFAANNQETHRQNINEIIPMRALYEIYFPGFKAAVQEGKVKSIMDAYNKINGTACAMNRWLLGDVLRDEWGFEGLVVSDWGAAYDQTAAIHAGNDLDMPGPRSIQPIVDAVNDGVLAMEDLDRAVEKMLNMLLDMPVMKGRHTEVIDREYSRKVAHESAAEGMVLLKNKDGLLPLSKSTRVGFMGEHSKKFVESGGGSAMVYTDQSTSMLETTKEYVGEGNVAFGVIDEKSDVVVITAAAWGQEGQDRASMDLDAAEKKMLMDSVEKAKALNKKIIVVLNVSGPVDMMDYIDDVDAVLCVFLPGQEGGRVAAEILFGDVNPSGKLPLTFPKHYKDCPTYGNFPGCAAEVCYGEGIFVGYRYYEYRDVEPLFPFGYGLTYSNFRIHDLKLDSDRLDMDSDGCVTASVKVKNISPVDGKEVVQLYIRDVKSTLVKPLKELKDFCKVSLSAGEEKTVSFKITKKQLESYDSEISQWVAEAGEYEILIGDSSDNIVQSASFRAAGETAYNYNFNTMICVLFEDERAKKVLTDDMVAMGIDVAKLDEVLYYFPEKSIGAILNQLCDGLDGKSKDECESWKNNVINKLRALDLSVL